MKLAIALLKAIWVWGFFAWAYVVASVLLIIWTISTMVRRLVRRLQK